MVAPPLGWNAEAGSLLALDRTSQPTRLQKRRGDLRSSSQKLRALLPAGTGGSVWDLRPWLARSESPIFGIGGGWWSRSTVGWFDDRFYDSKIGL